MLHIYLKYASYWLHIWSKYGYEGDLTTLIIQSIFNLFISRICLCWQCLFIEEVIYDKSYRVGSIPCDVGVQNKSGWCCIPALVDISAWPVASIAQPTLLLRPCRLSLFSWPPCPHPTSNLDATYRPQKTTSLPHRVHTLQRTTHYSILSQYARSSPINNKHAYKDKVRRYWDLV